MIKVKICGLKREEDIKYINEVNPDYIGFIFANSKRKVTPEFVKKSSEYINKNIKKVGVFVNEDLEEVLKIYEYSNLDIIQLHGEESIEYIRKIPEKVEVWKAIRVKDKKDIEIAKDYLKEPKVKKILLDAYDEKEYGGTGIPFDWNFLDNNMDDIVLAGGLNEMNIEKAIKLTNTKTVDVSSGVETQGDKDYFKIKNFVEKVRKYYE